MKQKGCYVLSAKKFCLDFESVSEAVLSLKEPFLFFVSHGTYPLGSVDVSVISFT